MSFSLESVLQNGLGTLTLAVSYWPTSCTWPCPAQRRTGHFMGLYFPSVGGAVYNQGVGGSTSL